MPQISFRYYKKGHPRSPNGDGDIKHKAQRLSHTVGISYSGLSISKICGIAIREWLEKQLDAEHLEIPAMRGPIAQRDESVTFANNGNNIQEMVGKLREKAGSPYKHFDNSRIYVIGINAWLDKEIDQHNPYEQVEALK